MIKSMTGFGKAVCECQNRKMVVEIKSLNSKLLDINARIPNGYREKEVEIRNLISNRLHRGKVDFQITIENSGDTSNYSINKSLAQKYYRELKELSLDLDEKDFSDYLLIIMRMPDVLVTEINEISEEEWSELKKAISQAIDEVDMFRINEGKGLENDLRYRNEKIVNLLEEVTPFEKARLKNLKAKISRDLHDVVDKEEIDKNRFEQELVYYQDKLDITEEKVRLKKHCEYFIETLDEPEYQGKKLIFISQEMGREINTLGSKAGEANIQKIVVQMKDELEKIKEQLFNIL
jgi:uncharacterized protein (TIGR00255 family)